MNDRVSYLRSVLLLAGLIFSALGCALLEAPAPAPTPTARAFPTLALPNSASAFDNNTLTGQPAPEFTLPDANGQAYTFAPSDGRRHVVVFYMFYG